ncbi:hypothetical protein GCM10010329_71050 [Streptomyces spiroverticillatus]|uniref:Uncharacterized protein n=1 Tax=Streptomyces finlayi TaxID=67296 RepID=A0A918X0P1_9ACTN|nr:hypothetical protein GCM10010329_71050 [Streptomyces spiroverticillatus]GHD01279.1 hypothetical protein GCM10010334_46760 [Streptomyces finlayi]
MEHPSGEYGVESFEPFESNERGHPITCPPPPQALAGMRRDIAFRTDDPNSPGCPVPLLFKHSWRDSGGRIGVAVAGWAT